jgi:hypothetical protein
MKDERGVPAAYCRALESVAAQEEAMYRASVAMLAGLMWLASAPAAALGVPGGADTKPPALKSLNVPATVDVSKTTDAIAISFTATDDSSGVAQVDVWVEGPGGQRIYFRQIPSLPGKQVTGIMLNTCMTAYLQPGAWVIQGASVIDVAGNVTLYDQSDLAKLGNTTFVVQNAGAFDASPPALTSGKILTPAVSLSSNSPGTDQPPFVGLTVNVTDAGNGVISGVMAVDVIFCLPDHSHCFTASQWGVSVVDAPSDVIQLGYQLNRGSDVPGLYELNNIYIRDFAGNFTNLQSDMYGGSTDFSLYFPSISLRIKP